MKSVLPPLGPATAFHSSCMLWMQGCLSVPQAIGKRMLNGIGAVKITETPAREILIHGAMYFPEWRRRPFGVGGDVFMPP